MNGTVLTLYHMRDSTSSQRVRLVLAEKHLEWESKLLAPADLRSPAYLGLNANGTVPALAHDELIITESRLICEYLDEVFENFPLMPTAAPARSAVRWWTKLFDDRLQLAIFVVTFVAKLRPQYLALSADAQATALPGLRDPVKRHVARSLLADAWNSKLIPIALRYLRELFDCLDVKVQASRWIVADQFTLADIDMLVLAHRLRNLGLVKLWASRPATCRWFENACARTSYDVAVDRWDDATQAQANREAADRLSAVFEPLMAG